MGVDGEIQVPSQPFFTRSIAASHHRTESNTSTASLQSQASSSLESESHVSSSWDSSHSDILSSLNHTVESYKLPENKIVTWNCDRESSPPRPSSPDVVVSRKSELALPLNPKYLHSYNKDSRLPDIQEMNQLNNTGSCVTPIADAETMTQLLQTQENGTLNVEALRNILSQTQAALIHRTEEVERLNRIRNDVEEELRELTASLFEEAHSMVREANEKRAAAEKALRESNMQVEVLQAEVSALKTLVLTSTPSHPNPHLHPQIDNKPNATAKNGMKIFSRHRRGTSDCDLKYGRKSSPTHSPDRESSSLNTSSAVEADHSDMLASASADRDVDPLFYREFQAWRMDPSLSRTHQFMARVYTEDMDLCLNFPNEELSRRVREAVETNRVFVEEVGDKTKSQFPKKCALLETPRICRYRMKLEEEDQWHYISQLCRNRIIAVCDFFTYLRYIQLGLVKASANEIYWEIVRLRKQMTLARLGLM